MNSGIIGGADGPTVILVAENGGVNWINVFGVVILALMLIPNIIYAVKFRGQGNKCTNKFMNVLEQIGRYGCMILMIFSIGAPKAGFTSVGKFLVYMFGNAALLLAYWIVWALYFAKQDKWKSMTLAIIPTCIFLLSGWMLEHWLLVIGAVVFGIAHICVIRENVK